MATRSRSDLGCARTALDADELVDATATLERPRDVKRTLPLFLVLAGGGVAHAATVGVAVSPGVGLEDAERAALQKQVADAVAASGVSTSAVGGIEDGCAADAACAKVAVDKAGVDALVVVEVMRVGDDAEVTETLVGKDGATLAHATASEPFAALSAAPLLPDVKAGIDHLATTSPKPAPPPPPAPKGDGKAGLGVALRADGALLHARTFDVTIDKAKLDNALSGDGVKGAGGGALLQLSWMIPVDGSTWNRAFGFEADVGYNVTATNGTIPFTQYQTKDGETSLVTTKYDYDSVIHVVPFSLGVRSRLPLPELPVRIDLSAGGSGLWGMSVAQASVDETSVAFAIDNTSTDMAWGFYAEGGVAWLVGPGELCASYRYMSAYLDFEHPLQNPGPGDLGGHHLLVGYRFTL